MKHKCSLKSIFATATLALATLTYSATTSAQSIFAHYKGIAGREYIKGMQQVHEFEYTYYVTPSSPRELVLPFEGFSDDKTRSDEPKGYIRWYDYNTDHASDRLSVYDTAKSLLKSVSDSEGNSRGLFAWKDNISSEPAGPNHYTVGVTYKAPAEANDENWQGDDIACDVSRYIDFGPTISGSNQYFTHEPTLQIRYIFHIRPAKAMAEQIVNTTSTDIHGKYSDLTLEDNKRIVFGAKNADALMAIKMKMPVTNYYFYPLKNTNHHVYSSDKLHEITSSDFNKQSMLHATAFQWRVYDQTKSKYTILASSTTMSMWSYTSMNILMTNRNGWKDLDGKAVNKPSISHGSTVYFVVYAKNGDSMAPVANFEVLYQSTYPKTRAQILADGDNDRIVEYLDSHYQKAAKPISFDDDNETLTLDAPTVENNISPFASKWDRRSYSYTYPELRDYTCPAASGVIHGEYGIYKSANVAGVSDKQQKSAGGHYMYSWNAPGNPVLYDRTYEQTGGKQYGYFLFVDASDESRQIAAADFQANLCSGARLIFSGAVTDYTATSGITQPQVMFKLYGITRDDNDAITDQRLITSFSSGDFANNTDGGRQFGKWFQVYSKMVLPKNSGAENFSDFRIVIDNMCPNTSGADYAIDDLRLYIQPAKVDVVQNKAVCPDEAGGSETPDHITLKISAHYDNIQAFTGEGVASKMFYRICKMDGTPVDGIDYNGDGKADEYGIAEVPANVDANKMLPEYAADGKANVKMFDTDAEGLPVLVLANRNFNLPLGQKFYVSVAYPDEESPEQPVEWGKSTDACSIYSEDFEIVQQNILITDANGNVVTTVRVSCDDDRTPNVNINGKLETADTINGGKITLSNVKFDWFLSMPDMKNDFTDISGLQEALRKYRDYYPTATSLSAGYQSTDADGYALLKRYVDSGQLIIAASNNLDNHKFGKDMMGTYQIAAIPIASSIKEGKTTYDICPDPLFFTLRIVEDGPRLSLGFADVTYPNDNRGVRIGLPQIRAMLLKGKPLTMPVTSLESSKKIQFENESSIFVSATNDPSFDSSRQVIGKIKNDGLESGESLLAMVFTNNALSVMHEGYWYELNFSFRQERTGTETVVSCPGETFITFKVVPEYLTWNSTPENRLNANWNNDLNWMRSTAADLYKSDYTDYGVATMGNSAIGSLTRQQAYTPMKFSKVTITDQTGKAYPCLGNITYSSGNKIATKLTNGKSEDASDGIAYDMVVKWNYATADHSDNGDGTFSCEKFQGNLCDQIYFKPCAELLNQTFLAYNKAYVEKELAQDKWYLMSSPLKDTYAGDLYSPKANCRQETEAFMPIRFDNAVNSRSECPVYQRNWDGNGQEVVNASSHYNAYEYNDLTLKVDTITNSSMNIESLYWSHVFNKVDESYAEGKGFAIKAGDGYTTATQSAKALFRLPKEDTAYSYFGYDGKEDNSIKEDVDKTDGYRLLIASSNNEDALGTVSQSLAVNTHAKNGYYIIGNPYTATLSLYSFLNGNPCLERKAWTLEGGVLTAHYIPQGAYNRKEDVLIEPMQAFFVKMKEGESADAAVFTQLMTVDRWISGGSSLADDYGVYDIDIACGGKRYSSAKIMVSGSDGMPSDDCGNVELLDNTESGSMPQAYTVAGSQAASLNRVSHIGFLPFGVVASSEKDVEIVVSRNRKAGDRLFLLDSKTGSYSPVANGEHVAVRTNEHGRYFLTSSIYNADSNSNCTVRCFSVHEGYIVVCSPNKVLKSVSVFSANGTLVASCPDINASSWQSHVGAGIFIVKAHTADNLTTTVKVCIK